VNVEEIMRQIRERIREKRGVDYTEKEIRDLAAVKLEQFLDPSKVRSDLLEQYHELQQRQMQAESEVVDEISLYGSPRPWLRRVRRLLRPVLKLFLNPVALMRASRVNVRHTDLLFEIVHNLVVETTRLSIELKTLKMRVESISSRMDFDERRARALEGVVQYRPGAAPQEPASAAARKDEDEGEGEAPASRSRRRRRRRGRRGGGPRPGGEDASPSAETEGPAAVEEPARTQAAPADQPGVSDRPGEPPHAGERPRSEAAGGAPEIASSPRPDVPRPSGEATPRREEDPGPDQPGD
jgi:hypothetical protein